MPEARDIALADAFAAYLVAKAYTLAPTVEVAFVPEWIEATELATLQLIVLPGLSPALTLENGERSGPRNNWELTVHIAKRLTAASNTTELRALLAFVDQLTRDLLPEEANPAGFTDSNSQAWQCAAAQTLRRFDPNELNREKLGNAVRYSGTFHSVLSTTWRRVT